MRARRFLCRDSLWQAFEEIAHDRGAPIDDVLSDAMEAYAQQRAQAASRELLLESTGRPGRTTDEPPLTTRVPRMPTPPPRPVGSIPPPPTRRQGGSARPVPSPPGSAPPSRSVPPPPRSVPPPSRSVPPPPRSVPPPLPSKPAVASGFPVSLGSPRLSLEYNGHRVDVGKSRFILGRSKAQSDLVLQDPNVSRQHAVIEQVGHDWFLIDLGSTNGCYIGVERVARRRVAHGDVIAIAECKIRCLFR